MSFDEKSGVFERAATQLAEKVDGDAARWTAAEEGAELLREGSLDQACAELRRVVEVDPQNHYAQYYLGCALFEQAEFTQALPVLLKALELTPGHLGALVQTGHTLRMLGHYDEAIRVGVQALRQRDEDQDALYLLALAHFARGDAPEAQAYIERFLNTRPPVETALEARQMLEVLGQDADD